MAASAPLVWIDMEMTGLDPRTCHVLEIATVITDERLDIVAEGPDLVVHQPDDVLANMDDWCIKHHGASGLTEAVRNSPIPLVEAERRTLEFLAAHTQPGTSPLCGNSVWQDRRFIVKHMPALHEFLHYRIVDVSTVRELVRRWFPQVAAPTKKDTHRARDDIRDSIHELRHFREHAFR